MMSVLVGLASLLAVRTNMYDVVFDGYVPAAECTAGCVAWTDVAAAGTANLTQDIVDGWANTFVTPRGDAMGFTADADLDGIVSVFLEDDLEAQHAYYE